MKRKKICNHKFEEEVYPTEFRIFNWIGLPYLMPQTFKTFRVCEICGSGFKRKKDCIKHIEKRHKSKIK